MEKIRNSKIAQVINNVNANPTPGVHISTYVNSMSTGEAVITSLTGLIVDATGILPPAFKIATKLSDGRLRWSDTIEANKIKRVSVQKYIAPTMQTEYIGYNGTTGSIDAIDNNLYTVQFRLLGNTGADFKYQRLKFATAKTGDNTTQYDVALTLTKSAISWFESEPEFKADGIYIINAAKVNSGSSSAIGGSETLSVLKGSKYVQSSGTSHALVAGDYIRIGHATDTTYPVYKVISVNSSTIELDSKYTGDTATGVAAGKVTVGTNWGVKFWGTTHTFRPPQFLLHISEWMTMMQDFGNTTFTSTKANRGSGSGKEVVQSETQLMLVDGNWYRAEIPAPIYTLESSQSKTYAIINIEFEAESTHDFSGKFILYKELKLYCEKGNGTVYSDAQTGLGTVLNAYIAAYKPVFTTSGSTTIATEINA